MWPELPDRWVRTTGERMTAVGPLPRGRRDNGYARDGMAQGPRFPRVFGAPAVPALAARRGHESGTALAGNP